MSIPSKARRRLACSALTLLFLAARAAAEPAPEPAMDSSLQAEVDQFVAADRRAPPAACRVLFVGSSSIVKWKQHLAADMAPLPVINRGFGGSQIEDLNQAFSQIVAPYRPRAIVFYAGENDLDAGKSVERVVADFDAFIARKSAVLGKTPVYFISLKPSKQRFAQLRLQARVNDAIRARSAERSDLRFIDVVPAMLENGRPKQLYVFDGLHMDRDGYAIWTRLVRAALLANSEGDERSCRSAD